MLPCLLTDVPVVIDRDDARRAAEAELAKHEYLTAQPNVWERAISWLGHKIAGLFEQASRVTPGGALGLLVLLAVVVLIVVVVRLRVGGMARANRVRREVFEDRSRGARDYRNAAEEAAAAGDFATAVRERFRAIIREFEERGVLDELSGRTADEAAREAGVRLPDARDELSAAAALFDAVHYGGHQVSNVDYERLVALDRGVPA
ncbi:DUF4129 domain-containing protein [Amycolatopsis pigmentata]|uniref:DUF4129 domain-containing protein n=1 Tax=Amycolatopsis pigmentata TaxID=450801 RepID=A0ABW5G4M4_9PSEU